MQMQQPIQESLFASAITDYYAQALGDDSIKFIDESVVKTERGTTIYTLEIANDDRA